jgi:hypothetical protein
MKTHLIEESELIEDDILEDYEAEMLHIDATKENKFTSKPESKQDPFFSGKSGRKLFSDTECPPSETYVGFVDTKTSILNNTFTISDIELRQGDRM